ncbi:MAG: methyltransferase domain-containing protein [Desulfobacteraceae bacterium]|nr:methyltransferase domain-containing protein [Desulfobacteraceae bacterium]
MNTIDNHSSADIFFQIRWDEYKVRHTEALHARNVNLWRDVLPDVVRAAMIGTTSGDLMSFEFNPGDIVPAFSSKDAPVFKNGQFNRDFTDDRRINPRQGRFFPKGILDDVPGIFKANITPFRLVGIENGHIHTDFNHPLSRHPLNLSATISHIRNNDDKQGGTVHHWMEELTEGPGMQAQWNQEPTDFFSDDPFAREDETADAVFYEPARMVHHLDRMARDIVRSIYHRHLEDDMDVLDLMSSWATHLPEKFSPGILAGLGMNEAELRENKNLTDRQVSDLNHRPVLPYADSRFDVVLCTVSVEYLTKPVDVFQEVARVLKPGGHFILTFSNRWFQPKVVRIWTELHEFERLGLVLEYFRRSGSFEQLETYTIRGLPRPRNDKYFPKLRFSDPVYAAWGRRRG